MKNNNSNNENSNTPDKSSFEEMLLTNSQNLKIPYEAYIRILNASLSQSEEDIVIIEKAIKENAYQDIANIAHRLKGVYGNLRIEDLHKNAESINILARDNGDINEIARNFQLFKNGFFDLKNSLLIR